MLRHIVALSMAVCLAQAAPLGVVVDGELFYVANSQWERFRDDEGIEAPPELRLPLVLRLRL